MAEKAQRFSSRQSMQNKTFEIFHYRDKKPENVGIHHHDFYEIYFFLGGHVTFTAQGKSYRLEPGDILLMSPMELHQMQVTQGSVYERMVLWIDCGFLQSLGGSDANLAACFDRTSPSSRNFIRPDKLQRASLLALLNRLDQEFYGDHFGSSSYATAILTQFMVEINRLSQHQVSHSEEPDLISQVLSFIGAHFREPITLEQLAQEFYVSKYYLSHEFQKRVGTSIYRYVIFRRLMESRKLMSAGEAPGTVYSLCGFGDYANFYRAFKSEFSISPREFILAP